MKRIITFMLVFTMILSVNHNVYSNNMVTKIDNIEKYDIMVS